MQVWDVVDFGVAHWKNMERAPRDRGFLVLSGSTGDPVSYNLIERVCSWLVSVLPFSVIRLRSTGCIAAFCWFPGLRLEHSCSA